MNYKGNVTIVGAGAMGSFYGSLLHQAGCDVQLLDIWQDHIDKINSHGLHLTRPNGTTDTIDMKAYHVDRPASDQADLLIVFVDTNSLDQVLPILKPLLNETGYVLTLQNGIGNVEKLLGPLGVGRVVAGTSMHSCELLSPGHIRHVISGTTVLGEITGNRVSERVHDLAKLIATNSSQTEAVGNVVPHIWSKLVINCAINPLCALTGLLPGQLQEVEETKRLQAQIVSEIEALCTAKEIILPEDAPIKEVWRKSRGGNNKPSMVQHLERGRKTEIDALNGAVSRMATEVGLAAPINATITSLIKGLEKTCPANTDD